MLNVLPNCFYLCCVLISMCWRRAPCVKDDVKCMYICMFTCICSPSLVGVFLMVFVYREGNNGQEKFNEITMANLDAQSNR